MAPLESVAQILERLLQEHPFDQTFSVEDEDGTQHLWNVTRALKLAQEEGQLKMVDLKASGLTPEFILSHYTDLNQEYALTTDLSRPLLFIPHNGKDQLLDGWHRLYKAASLGQNLLPAWFLTQEQADSVLICTVCADKGIDWGQKAKAS